MCSSSHFDPREFFHTIHCVVDTMTNQGDLNGGIEEARAIDNASRTHVYS